MLIASKPSASIMHRLSPGAATGIARNLAVVLIVLVTCLAGAACRSALAQQCAPAGGGPPCETAAGVAVWNPAFDVTPAELVTAIVTDRGVVPPAQISRLMD